MEVEEAKEFERYASEEQENENEEPPRTIFIEPRDGGGCLVSGVWYHLRMPPLDIDRIHPNGYLRNLREI